MREYRGPQAPDVALIDLPKGTFYRQTRTSIWWYKYGANPYNWRPYSCDRNHGIVGAGVLHEGEFSLTNFTATSGGTATALVAQGPTGGEQGRYSTITFSVKTNAVPDRTRLFKGGGGSPPQGLVPGGGAVYLFESLKIPVLSDGTDNFLLRLLGGDSLTNAAHANGCWIEQDYATYGDNSLRGRTALGGANSTIDLSVTPTAGVYFDVGLVINADGTLVTFLYNDLAVGTLNANIPVLPANGFSMVDVFHKTTGTVNALTYVVDDYYDAILSNIGR